MRMAGLANSLRVATTLLLMQLGHPALAGTNDAGLAGYIGSYDNESLIHHPRIEETLAGRLGDAWPHLLRNLEVRGAVDLVSGELSLAGNAIHGGGSEEAVLCVSPTGSRASAAIFSQGVVTVYSDQASYEALGLCIKDWITQVNSGHRDRLHQPGNVVLAGSREP